MQVLMGATETGLDRIRSCAQDFYEKVHHFVTTPYNAADCQDTYNRLSRLRDRYLHEVEEKSLTPVQHTALRKVFEEDGFIQGMLEMRQAGEHVKKRDGPVIRLRTGKPIPLSVETSALAFFGQSVFMFKEPDGKVHFHSHADELREAEHRVKAAMRRALGE
jgi:hypothetical protein